MYKIIFATTLLLLFKIITTHGQGKSFSNIDELVLPDSINSIIISKIDFVGNKKTKDIIIRRELKIKAGDTLLTKNLRKILRLEENKILNTSLFVTVDLMFKADTTKPQHYDLSFILKESWYIFPLPTFDLADRNFNEWVNVYNADLNRVNYGGLFVKKNIRGRNETLSATLQLGFTKKYMLSYNIPYIDKSQKHGVGFSVSYTQNKTVPFNTKKNKLLFTEKLDKVGLEKHQFSTYLSRRNGFYKHHTLSASYNISKISDTIASLNPDYFLESKTSLKYLNLAYNYIFDKRDFATYPLKGDYFSVSISKSGIFDKDIDILAIGLKYTHYFPIFPKKLYGKINISTLLSSKQKRAYPFKKVLGYRNNVRGYQKYVIDGQDLFLVNTSLKWQLLKFRKNFNFIPIKEFRTIPVNVYLRPYFDIGYVNDSYKEQTENILANKWLVSTGIGLDIITFYNVTIQLDYGINIEGDRGFFLNVNTSL